MELMDADEFEREYQKIKARIATIRESLDKIEERANALEGR